MEIVELSRHPFFVGAQFPPGVQVPAAQTKPPVPWPVPCRFRPPRQLPVWHSAVTPQGAMRLCTMPVVDAGDAVPLSSPISVGVHLLLSAIRCQECSFAESHRAATRRQHGRRRRVQRTAMARCEPGPQSRETQDVCFMATFHEWLELRGCLRSIDKDMFSRCSVRMWPVSFRPVESILLTRSPKHANKASVPMQSSSSCSSGPCAAKAC